MRVPGGNNSVFSAPPVAFGTEVPGVIQFPAARFQDAGLDKHSFIQKVGIDLLSNSNDNATNVGPLDSGKLNGISGPDPVTAVRQTWFLTRRIETCKKNANP